MWIWKSATTTRKAGYAPCPSCSSRFSWVTVITPWFLRSLMAPLDQAPLTEAKKVQQAKAEAKQGSIFLTMTLRYLAHSFFIQIEHFSRSSVFAQPVRSKLQQSIQLSVIALKIVVSLLWLIYICPDLRTTKTNRENKQHKTVLRGLLKELPYFNYKGNLAEFHGRLLLRSRLFWICPNASSFRRRWNVYWWDTSLRHRNVM